MAAASSKSLTSRELVDEIVARQDAESSLDAQDVKAVLALLVEVVSVEVQNGIKVKVPGLVTIKPVYRAAKPKGMTINPRNGEERERKASPAKIALKATPVKTLKQDVPSAKSAIGKAMAAEAAKKAKQREANAKKRAREAAAAETAASKGTARRAPRPAAKKKAVGARA